MAGSLFPSGLAGFVERLRFIMWKSSLYMFYQYYMYSNPMKIFLPYHCAVVSIFILGVNCYSFKVDTFIIIMILCNPDSYIYIHTIGPFLLINIFYATLVHNNIQPSTIFVLPYGCVSQMVGRDPAPGHDRKQLGRLNICI